MEAAIAWKAADAATRQAWANSDDATEQAAYGIAIAAIKITHNLIAVKRAETRTGADYYLAASGDVEDLEETFRLEVSGTDKGSASQIRARLSQKADQARKGNSNLPAIASVVGFQALMIVSDDVV
jgi:hypothetical protein